MCASMCVFGEFTRKLTRFQVARLVTLGVVHMFTTAGAVIPPLLLFWLCLTQRRCVSVVDRVCVKFRDVSGLRQLSIP